MELFGASEDPDKLCSYSTKQQVEIQNKWLGLIQWTMQTAMVTYIVFGIFIYSRGYLDYEPSRGAALAVFEKRPNLFASRSCCHARAWKLRGSKQRKA
eukprot:symbB.v1.2.032646.t1/scaffold3947.1/size47711/2